MYRSGVNHEFLVATVDGKEVRIPLGLKRPVIDDFEDFQDWLNNERAFAKSIVRRMENGEVLDPRSIKKEMEGWSLRAQQMFKKSCTLRVERTMLYLDMQIRTSLSCEQPNLSESLNLLSRLKSLPITPLMIKKNPHIVDTLDKVTSYVGKFSPGDQATSGYSVEVAKNIEKVKMYGSAVMRKLRELFEVPDDKSFNEVFRQQLKKYDQHIQDMGLNEIIFMAEEPQEWSDNKGGM